MTTVGPTQMGAVVQWCFTAVSNNHSQSCTFRPSIYVIQLISHQTWNTISHHSWKLLLKETKETKPKAGGKEKKSDSVKKLKDVFIHYIFLTTSSRFPSRLGNVWFGSVKSKWFIFPLSPPADVWQWQNTGFGWTDSLRLKQFRRP